jgi:hypothetical protein
MTMTLEELAKQRIEQREQEEKSLCGCGCGEPLDAEGQEGNLTIDGRLVRADCWYNAIGSFVEQNPIHHPGRRGPGGSNLGPGD